MSPLTPSQYTSITIVLLFIVTSLSLILLRTYRRIDVLKDIIKTLQDFKRIEHPKAIREARDDALSRSRAVIKGQISENLAPFMKEFSSKYQASNARFLGNPIDYIVFSDDEVVIVEIKSGSSRLNEKQRRIRDLIDSGKFRFEVIRLE